MAVSVGKSFSLFKWGNLFIVLFVIFVSTTLNMDKRKR